MATCLTVMCTSPHIHGVKYKKVPSFLILHLFEVIIGSRSKLRLLRENNFHN